MTDRSRIPLDYVGFNSYMYNTTTYLVEGTPTNAERLGLSTEMVDQWSSFKDRFEPYFIKYEDKLNQRTTSVINNMKKIILDCRKFDQDSHMLNLIANSNAATLDDFEVFRIKKGQVLSEENSTIPQTPIAASVQAVITPRGGGDMYIQCGNNVNTRTAIVEKATVVEYRYCIGPEVPECINSKMLEFGYSTKASFTLHVGAENSGQSLFIYFRWNNTKHPDLAGPWCQLQKHFIL